MNALAVINWGQDSSGIVAVLIVIALLVGLCLWGYFRGDPAHMRREGYGKARVRSISSFDRIEPPARQAPAKRVLTPLSVHGRLTAMELLEIENRAREHRNVSSPGLKPFEISLMSQGDKLAFVDVPRLLAHIRLLEERPGVFLAPGSSIARGSRL